MGAVCYDDKTSRPVGKSDRLSSGHSGAYFDFDVLDRIKEHEARGFCRPMKEPVLTVIGGHLEGNEVDNDDDEDEDDDGRSVGELVGSDDEEEVVTPEMAETAKRIKEVEAEFDDYMARPMSAKEVLDVL